MNVIEFKEPKTDNVINNVCLRDSEKFEHYYLFINDEKVGRLEKSDIRHFIEIIDSNYEERTEMFLNGSSFGNISSDKQKQLIKHLDGKIHH